MGYRITHNISFGFLLTNARARHLRAFQNSAKSDMKHLNLGVVTTITAQPLVSRLGSWQPPHSRPSRLFPHNHTPMPVAVQRRTGRTSRRAGPSIDRIAAGLENDHTGVMRTLESSESDISAGEVGLESASALPGTGRSRSTTMKGIRPGSIGKRRGNVNDKKRMTWRLHHEEALAEPPPLPSVMILAPPAGMTPSSFPKCSRMSHRIDCDSRRSIPLIPLAIAVVWVRRAASRCRAQLTVQQALLA